MAEIDGVDVTRRDLAAELQAIGNYDAAPSALLEQVIERKLLLRAAGEARIDQTPEYLAAIRRDREQLLSEMYAQRLARSLPAPSRAELADYVNGHPFAFARHAIIEAVRFDVPATAAVRAVLASAGDARIAATALSTQGVRVTPVDETLDSATLAPAIAEGLTRSAPGLFVTPSATGLIAYQVRTVRPAPLAGSVADTAAARAIGTMRLTRLIADRINIERRRARIHYQAGLGPSSQKD